MANGAGTNDDCVADHAFALLLATVRAIPALDRACRAGVWRDELPMQPNFSGRRLGVVGLGNIGRKVARRALGFDLEVGYHNRHAQPETTYAYFDALIALAGLGRLSRRHDAGRRGDATSDQRRVLAALGPRGYLVNVARGSVVDTAALARALEQGVIAGAGLDVYEGEPAPPALLTGSPARGADAACRRTFARGAGGIGGALHRQRDAALLRPAGADTCLKGCAARACAKSPGSRIVSDSTSA